MKKKLSGWITAAVCLLLIIVLYFLAPAHPFDAGEITYANVTRIDNRINLNEKQVKDLNALLAEVTAKRCFAPANITEDESALMVDITTKYSLQGTTQGRYLTGGVPPVRFSM